MKEDAKVKLVEPNLSHYSTPGSIQSIAIYGFFKDQARIFAAVQNGSKPVGTLGHNMIRQFGWLKMIERSGLKIGAHDLLYRNTLEGKIAYELTRAIIDSQKLKHRSEAYHYELGQAFGYADREINEFIHQPDDQRKMRSENVRKEIGAYVRVLRNCPILISDDFDFCSN